MTAARSHILDQASAIQYAEGQAAELTGDLKRAVQNYQTALRLNPGNGESITALGRLRFNPPPQPYLEELRAKLKTKVYTIVIEVRNPCNFRCFYCLAKGSNAEPVQKFDFDRIEKLFAHLEKIEHAMIVTNLECGGGEPTVHPEFPQLARLGSRYGAFCFPSNNSQNPERWLPKEQAERIIINSALHPEGEAQIDKYIKNARTLIDAGARFQSVFICHPARIHKVPEYRELFAKHNIPFTPISFLGEHEGKIYPGSHTAEEQKLMGLTEGVAHWMHRIDPYVSKNRNFRGIPCLAGYQSFYLTNQGRLQRCYFDKKPIEAPLTKAEPCRINHCSCGLMLEKLNLNDTGDMYNSCAKQAGDFPHFDDAEILKKHGYDSASDAVLKEQTAMYDALMEAYGKTEYPEPIPRR